MQRGGESGYRAMMRPRQRHDQHHGKCEAREGKVERVAVLADIDAGEYSRVVGEIAQHQIDGNQAADGKRSVNIRAAPCQQLPGT